MTPEQARAIWPKMRELQDHMGWGAVTEHFEELVSLEKESLATMTGTLEDLRASQGFIRGLREAVSWMEFVRQRAKE